MNFLERKRTSRDLRGATESDFSSSGHSRWKLFKRIGGDHKENIMKTTTGILTLIGKSQNRILTVMLSSDSAGPKATKMILGVQNG